MSATSAKPTPAALAVTCALALAFVAGCTPAPRNLKAVNAYYRYDFTAARDALRPDATQRNAVAQKREQLSQPATASQPTDREPRGQEDPGEREPQLKLPDFEARPQESIRIRR